MSITQRIVIGDADKLRVKGNLKCKTKQIKTAVSTNTETRTPKR